MGTPSYLAPEQSYRAAAALTTDVFSLGVILFELLTGQLPFNGSTLEEIVQAIRDADPPLPRTLNESIPGPLQAICLTALEKNPKKRYPGANEFLQDVQRYLRGEAVLADPSLLRDCLEHGVERHTNDLSLWQKDRMITRGECDVLDLKYDALRQREKFWVLDSRRITLSQVLLYLGGWACVISALIVLCNDWESLTRVQRVILPFGIFAFLSVFGLVSWLRHSRRIALVLLMAGAMTCPVFASNTLIAMKWLAGSQTPAEQINEKPGPPQDLLGEFMSNRQLLAATGVWVALNSLFWLLTRTSAFSLIWSISLLSFGTAIFSFFDLRGYLLREEFDVVVSWFLIPSLILLAMSMLFDLRWRAAPLALPMYIISVGVGLLALTVIAIDGSSTEWLGITITAKTDNVTTV